MKKNDKTINFFSKISIRLLIFNLLLVFFPIGSALYLKTYEKLLLKSLEDSMVQQGRLISAVFSKEDKIDKNRAKMILENLNLRLTSRIRIVDTQGNLLADSSIIKLPEKNHTTSSIALWNEYREEKKNKDNKFLNFLYDLSLYPIRLFRKLFFPPVPSYESADFYGSSKKIFGPEIKSALDEKYGAITRLSAGGQKSLTLYSAIPVKGKTGIIGAVLVSQSTFGILNNLYEVRKDILKIFLISIIFALILSIILDFTISRPLKKLRDEARSLVDKKGRLIGTFKAFNRSDEIGELSISLKELTKRLESHISFIESFSSDISHEMKNPLSSIRSASEILNSSVKKNDDKKFIKIIQNEAGRMENLLSGVRELAKIDLSINEEKAEKIEIISILNHIIENYKLRGIRHVIKLNKEAENVYIKIPPARFVQIIENLVDNAVSFSKENENIEININKNDSKVFITVKDNGTGIDKKIIDKIFNRFFSYRANVQNKEKHTGLGLSIVKSIVDAYSGSICAKTTADRGAEFIIEFPAL